MATEQVVQLRGVEFAYAAGGGAFALRVPEFSLARGEAVACVGPSGCGKTTLLHLVAGVLAPGRGSVRVLGEELGSMAEGRRRELRLRRVGMVFQEFELLEYLTARENVLIASRFTDLDRRELGARADALAEAAGVGHLLARKPRRLSQGERQRVALCRALVTRPELVLCDEPTGNLDPETTRRVLDLVLDRARADGAGVLCVTHNHDLLSRFDRVFDIGARSSAASERRAGLVGASGVVSGERERGELIAGAAS